jgi:N-methylhydantoinase A
VPPAPGVFSAFGLLRADIEHHAARTVLTSTAQFDDSAINRAIAAMRDELIARMHDEGYAADAVKIAMQVDLRYRGQSSEITVALPEERVSESALRAAEQRFESEFERTYGHRGNTQDFELVTCRLIATVPRATHYEARWKTDAEHAAPARAVYFGATHGALQTRVVTRKSLADAAIAGPAIVQEYDTSVVIPPGWQARLDAAGNIVATAT